MAGAASAFMLGTVNDAAARSNVDHVLHESAEQLTATRTIRTGVFQLPAGGEVPGDRWQSR